MALKDKFSIGGQEVRLGNFLDFNPCLRPYGISNILLRSCRYSLSVPKSKIFN